MHCHHQKLGLNPRCPKGIAENRLESYSFNKKMKNDAVVELSSTMEPSKNNLFNGVPRLSNAKGCGLWLLEAGRGLVFCSEYGLVGVSW